MAICLSDSLISTPYTYFSAQKNKANHELFSTGLYGTLFLGIFLAITSLSITSISTDALDSISHSLPFAILTLALREFYRRHLYIHSNAKTVFLGDALTSALQVCILAAFSYHQGMSAKAAFIAISLASIASLFLFIHYDKTRINTLSLGAIRYWLTQYFLYGRWLILGTACHVASIQLYPWLALTGGGTKEAGIYAACIALANLLNPLLTGLTNYFRPKLMIAFQEKDSSQFRQYIQSITALFTIPAIAFCLVLSLFGEHLLAALYGKDFTQGADALSYMGLAVIAIAISAPLQLALLATRAPITNLIYHGLALGLLTLLSGVFWPSFTTSMLGQIYGAINLTTLVALTFMFHKYAPRQ